MRSSLWPALLAALALLAVSAGSASAAGSPPSLLFAHEAVRGTAAPVKGTSGQWNVTLYGAPAHVLAFEDRPGRLAEQVTMQRMLTGFFASDGDPPNASLGLRTRSAKLPRLIAVELLDGRYDVKRHIVRYRVRTLASSGKGVAIPRRFTAASVFIDDFGTVHTCSATLIGGVSYDPNAKPLALIAADKYSHDQWGINDGFPNAPGGVPPSSLAGMQHDWLLNRTERGEVSWGSQAGWLRGCDNSAIYGDQYGSVTVRVKDPYSGSNSYTCTTSGNYRCFGPLDVVSTLGGDFLNATFSVCATNDQACIGDNQPG